MVMELVQVLKAENDGAEFKKDYSERRLLNMSLSHLG